MRATLLITKIFFFVFLIAAMVIMSNKASQYLNRLSHYFKDIHSKSPKDHSPYGGTLVWGTVNPPTIINPVFTSNSISTSLLELLFDPLVHTNENGVFVPGLAQSWDISSDGLSYTFHLRSNVYFHDGVECTAQDAKYTYDAIHDPVNQSPGRDDTALVSHWDVVDRYTLRVVLKRPFPGFLFTLAREILPQHLYEHTDLLTNPHNYSPVGTGPFRFVSWDKQTNQIVLEANDHYFEGRPFLDKIVVKTYENNSDLWAALMRGEIDLVNFLNYQDYRTLSKDPTFKTYQVPSGLYFALIYNMHDPILFDHDLRHAVNYAIDRKALMQVAGINGIESNGPFYPQSPWFNKEVEAPSYNPVRARLMLAWRGWTLGKDGILEKAGQPLILTMLVDRNRQFYYQMALVLRQELSEIGIALKIVFYDDESQLTPEYLEQIKPQMWLRMLGGKMDPSDMVRNWYSSSNEFGCLWSYQNEAIDRLFDQGLTLKDDQQRKDIYRKIHALIYEDQSTCFLFYMMSYHAVSNRLNNTDIFFTGYMPDYTLKDWFINERR